MRPTQPSKREIVIPCKVRNLSFGSFEVRRLVAAFAGPTNPFRSNAHRLKSGHPAERAFSATKDLNRSVLLRFSQLRTRRSDLYSGLITYD